jgi:hypothetical protein
MKVFMVASCEAAVFSTEAANAVKMWLLPFVVRLCVSPVMSVAVLVVVAPVTAS